MCDFIAFSMLYGLEWYFLLSTDTMMIIEVITVFYCMSYLTFIVIL